MKRTLIFFLHITTWLLGIVYIISCFTPVISPVDFWPMSFLALGFPYIALMLALYILLWFFIRKKVAIILLIVLCCGYSNIAATVALSVATASKSDSTTFRVLAWNVRNFDNPADHADHPNAVRRKMLNYIKEVNADVLCLQEMVEYVGPSFLSNIQALKDLGYVYYYKPSEINYFQGYGSMYLSNAIFSKHPIVDSASRLLNDPSFPEKIIQADIRFQGKNIRIINTHFRSINLFAENPESKVPFHYDNDFITNASKFEKLKIFPQEHAIQAEIANKIIKESPYPIVFAADLNSVPASYAYYKTKGDLQDAFLKRGNGLGGTLDILPKTLRIDYFFASKDFCIVNYQKRNLALSDHFPHYIDIKWKR